MNEDQLAAYGNDPRVNSVCERAIKLHHRQQSGPLPYATVLAIAAMCTSGEIPEPVPLADDPGDEPELKPKPQINVKQTLVPKKKLAAVG
jgi:hypothetical protein